MILDGYNFDGRLSDGEGVCLRFVYRPMLSSERRQYIAFLRQINAWEPDRVRRLEAEWIGRHIVAMEAEVPLHNLRQSCPRLFKMLSYVVAGVVRPDNDPDLPRSWELDDASNLRDGIVLILTEPALYRRTCEDCAKWWFDETTRLPVLNRDGTKCLRTDEPKACQTADGCPVGKPEDQKRLSLRNAQAWNHFRLCEAVGEFPDDPIVQRNALVIKAARQKAMKHGRRLPSGVTGRRPGADVGGNGGLAGRGPAAAGDGGFFTPFGDAHF